MYVTPIITSLLDTDYYKFTMGQYAWKYFPKVKVKYAFKNRTKNVQLGKLMNKTELLYQFDKVRGLRFTLEELDYLKNLGIFSNDYLSYLNNLVLPPVYIEESKGKLIIETEGLWPEAIFWETFILSIVNELYCEQNRGGIILSGNIELENKIEILNQSTIKFVDFGTRRRFSKAWQENVIATLLKNKCKGLLGTSNVYLAKKYKLNPIGTFAHELPMVIAGTEDNRLHSVAPIRKSHSIMLNKWYELYGEFLSIALTDTFGSKFFFEDFKDKAKSWKGLRQDSGNPFEFGHKAIKYYKDLGIDPKTKIIIFSDGLDIDKIRQLQAMFEGKIKIVYGWGTNLTNDRGIRPLSIVVKSVEANGKPLVKLSDNIAKAIGDGHTLVRYKQAFGYTLKYNEPTVY